MTGYYDVYCLAPARTGGTVGSFLERYAPAREAAADEYELPQYADEPDRVFSSVDQIIAHCVSHPTEPYSIYWRCLNEGDPAHAMAFFTLDGAVILGLSVRDHAPAWLDNMKSAIGGTAGWIGFETPPPDTAGEFLALSANQPLG